MSELAKKLGIKPGLRVCLLETGAGSAAAESAAAVRSTCQSIADLSESFEQVDYDLIFTWPHQLADLVTLFSMLERRIHPNGAIWVIMPKKKYAPGRGVDYSWDEMQAAGLQTDLVDNKVASIDEQDYGTRFVIRKDKRVRRKRHE